VGKAIEGTDAQAEVSVRLAHEGRSMTSKGSDPDGFRKGLSRRAQQDRHETPVRHAGAAGELTAATRDTPNSKTRRLGAAFLR
jgi:hypothetical protein